MQNKKRITRLLTVGPLPPPPSGANISFQVFCAEAVGANRLAHLEIIDSSPKRIKQNTSILTLRNLSQAWRVIQHFATQIKRMDAALIFGSNQFLASLTPILVLIAKLSGKPCYIRSFGGSVDQFSQQTNGLLRWLLLTGFRLSNGLIVETQLLYNYFKEMPGVQAHYVPAYRTMPKTGSPAPALPTRDDAQAPKPLRLVFISWVREEKGVTVLLEALRQLAPEEQAEIHCDIYGPLLEQYRHQFESELERTSCAHYGGILEPELVVPTLQNYDALVFPTFWRSEGQPGIVVESMIAGIPAIATNYRSVPEVITHQVNGLLVEPHNSFDLAEAIRLVLHNRPLLLQMGRRNWEMRTQYDTDTIIAQLLRILNVDAAAATELQTTEFLAPKVAK
ncbi:MAG: glycosyltransferase family 4 protein [Caldilineaceae bacterium]|nr:glycosyltransferase family 4 protein [Caldilineaceae bacterium]